MALDRREFLYTSATALVGATLPASAFGQAPAQTPPPAVTKFEDIRGNVGIFTGRGGTIGWLATPAGAIAVDAQFPDTAKACVEGLQQKSPKGIQLLINTHYHGDHTGGNPAFRPAVKSIVQQERCAKLHKDTTAKAGTQAQQAHADVTFGESWSQELGGEKVWGYYYGPGHLRRLRVDIESIDRLENLPPLPIQMFKRFDLRTCAAEAVVRTVQSSGTSSGVRSQVPLDRATAIAQQKGLSAILADHLGSRRRPFLVIDHAGMNRDEDSFTARTAGIRGLSLFARETIHLLREDQGRLALDLAALDRLDGLRASDVYAFGFTWIVWTELLPRLEAVGRRFEFAGFKLLHSGGWKRLREASVSKQAFSDGAARAFGARAEDVLDFYGMAEQTGVIFVDCPEGHKHVPAFAQVIVRDASTLRVCEPGEPGLIEIVSVLATSYPSQAILTEDVGHLVAYDGCPCGRRGRTFRFQDRLEHAELRGCGDTFHAP